MPGDPRGILTEVDEEFLDDPESYYDGEYASQSKYERQRGIRRRIVASILDFSVVRWSLDDVERLKIFDEPDEQGADDALSFHAALESLLGWIYLGCRESGPSFERLLSNAIEAAEEDYQQKHRGEIVDVDVSFDVTVSSFEENVEEIARALEAGDAVRARVLYRIPTLGDVDLDIGGIDVVRVFPTQPQRKAGQEKRVLSSILSEFLGLDAEIEFIGRADISAIEDELDDETPS